MKNSLTALLVLAVGASASGCKKDTQGNNAFCPLGFVLFIVPGLICYAAYGFDTGETHTRDLLSELQATDENWIEEKGQELATRFSLSEEQGLKVARMHRDFALIQDRSDSDLEDFSRRLYGVSPREVEAAIEASQLGHSERFNVLIEEGAAHFGTAPETFKIMVKGLYGSALESAGVAL